MKHRLNAFSVTPAAMKALMQLERAALARFTPQERVHLTLLIGMINVWNRTCVGFRSIPAMGTRTAEG